MNKNEEIVVAQKYLDMAEIPYVLAEEGSNKKITVVKENGSIFATEVSVIDSALQIRRSCSITDHQENGVSIFYENVESICDHDIMTGKYRWLETYDTINAFFSKEDEDHLLLTKTYNTCKKDETEKEQNGQPREETKHIVVSEIDFQKLKQSIKKSK